MKVKEIVNDIFAVIILTILMMGCTAPLFTIHLQSNTKVNSSASKNPVSKNSEFQHSEADTEDDDEFSLEAEVVK